MEIKKVNFLIAMIILSISGYSQSLEKFNITLNDCGMNVVIPSGYIEKEIIKNNDMNYDYAIKKADSDFELRYAIRPIRFKKYENTKIQEEIESQVPFRNSQYYIILQTTILNITGGNEYEIQAFNKDAVKNEFNADWGASAFIELNSDFGKGYKYCMVVAIHKDNVADAYYFYLSNTKENISENMDPLFHTLRFN